MKKIVIAFDCDGTLIRDGAASEHEIIANERIRTLLISLYHMKNTRIVVWSGGGELWARQVVAALGLQYYVHAYADKIMLNCDKVGCKKPKNTHGFCGTHHFGTPLKPDIAIDDIQACELGGINLIVNEK